MFGLQLSWYENILSLIFIVFWLQIIILILMFIMFSFIGEVPSEYRRTQEVYI